MSRIERTGGAQIPEDLIDAVVQLVSTGPVALGAYTLAEVDAVNGVIDFIERKALRQSAQRRYKTLIAASCRTAEALLNPA